MGGRRWTAVFFAALAVGLGGFGAAASENEPPAVGRELAAFSLPAPKEAFQAEYLGLGERKEFRIADIRAEVVLIEIFNMY